MKYIVVDLEMNPVSRSKEYRHIRRALNDEVIEFGAVVLDENFKRSGDFRAYVRPSFGKITKRITNLTGITEEKVADESDFTKIFKEFCEWVGEGDVKIYSWSMSDLKQLRSECRYKIPDFDVEWLNSRWIDLQAEFDTRLGLTSSLALKHALGAMGYKFEGKAHTALDDAINTSSILALMQDDVKFRQTMQPIIDILKPSEDLSSSIGELFPELAELKDSMED